MNYLLANEEAECGLNPNSEDLDLDAEEDDGSTPRKRWSMKSISERKFDKRRMKQVHIWFDQSAISESVK